MTDAEKTLLDLVREENTRDREDHSREIGKNRRSLVLAIITALTTGGGGASVAFLQNETDKELIKSQTVTEIAHLHEWREGATVDLKELRAGQQRLREALIRLQATTETRRRGPDMANQLEEIKKLLDKKEGRLRVSRPMNDVPTGQVRKTRARMFHD